MRQTRKYSQAVAAATAKGISVDGSQDALYQRLTEGGYFWDSGACVWAYAEPAAADDPTPLVRVRVWAASAIVEREAQQEIADRQARGYTLIERSDPYVCRPPKQRESRVYLAFLPPQEPS
jgi:hypothetical protein